MEVLSLLSVKLNMLVLILRLKMMVPRRIMALSTRTRLCSWVVPLNLSLVSVLPTLWANRVTHGCLSCLATMLISRLYSCWRLLVLTWPM